MGGIYNSTPVATKKRLVIPSAVLTLTGQPAGARAVGVLTLTGNAVEGETVTIGATVYTWRAAAGAEAFAVTIGANASASIDNLIAAINAAAGAGSLYGTGTTAHPSVRAAAGAGDTMDVRANVPGTAGNAIATTETMTNGSFGGGTLASGVNPETFTADGVVYSFVSALPEVSGPPNPTIINEVLIGGSASITLDNLIAAMNGAAGAGTTYSTGTVAQSRIQAAAGAGDTVDFTPKAANGGASPTPVVLAEAIANGSLNRTEMADGSAYLFEIPCGYGSVSSMQIVHEDATSAYSGSFETTNQDQTRAPIDAIDPTKWSAEGDVTIDTVAAGAAGSKMYHLSGLGSRRSRLKIIPTAISVLSIYSHGKAA